METNNPFEQAINCQTKTEKVTSESNNTVNFMLIRALSMSDTTFFVAASANEYNGRVPPWAVRIYAHAACPRGRPGRPAFIKKTKTALTEKEQRIAKQIEKVLHVSPQQAEESFYILKNQNVNFEKIFGQKIGAK